MTFHFDCIFYYVSDLDRSIRFYTDVLGFRFVSRDLVARFDVEGVLFEVVLKETNNAASHGNGRFCLRVDDVAAALQELRAKGVRVEIPEDKGAGVLGTFYDPDGNELCLWQHAQAR